MAAFLKQIEEEKPWKIGLCQALLVGFYCGLITTSISLIAQKNHPDPPGFSGLFLMLNLLVFSAALTGSLVFAFPTYLAFIRSKIKEAIQVLAFTMLFFLVLIASAILFIVGISS